ncbi:MAG TPA: branched-chain amino acid ABC transporter permease [Hyphomicrobiales bacterium]|nr:branched-chain amino acid ABC transporter permease [Hyphomicrobiales bacterium]
MNRNFLTVAVLGGLIVLTVIASEALGIRLYDRIATTLCIALVLVLGLQVFMGNSGILSFAHIGFMGVGAYTSAVLTIPVQMKGMALPDLYPVMQGIELSPYLAIAAGGLVAALVAAVVSYPLMRLSDAAAVITSFALLVVLYTIMSHWSEVTNGPRTLFGLPQATDLRTAAVVALIALGAALAFKESRTGRLLRASRDDEHAAAAIGANIPLLRWRAFVLAALFAGIGGGLWGHFITSFSPKAFYLKETFLILSMLVIGGPATVTGAVIGTFVVTVAYESLRALEGLINEAKLINQPVIGLTEIVLALAMIGVLVLRPGGLFASREIGVLIARRMPKWENRPWIGKPPTAPSTTPTPRTPTISGSTRAPPRSS